MDNVVLYCGLTIMIIKGFALVVGIVIALFSTKAHWNTIFKPNLKKVKNHQFEVTKDIYSFVTDYRFLPLLIPGNRIPLNILINLANEKVSKINNLFIPNYIKKDVTDLLHNFVLLLLHYDDQGHQNYEKRLIEINKKISSKIKENIQK